MAQKPILDVRSTGSQRDNRFIDTFHDQHKHRLFPNGRPWTGWRERPANQNGDKDQPGFTGSDLQPGDHTNQALAWHAPFMPTVDYFRFDFQYKRINIHYDKLYGHDVAAYDRYYEAAARLSQEKGQDTPDYGVIPKGFILNIIGAPPRSPRIAEALMAGDAWLLGFSTDVNEELALALGLSRTGYKLHKERSRWEQAKTPARVAPATPEDVLSFTPDRLKELMADVAAQAAAAAVAAERERLANAGPAPRKRIRPSRAKSPVASPTEASAA